MTNRVKMVVELNVTPAQALALEAMFNTWNYLSNIGSSRYVAFFVDGDGNFKPHCKVTQDPTVPPLTDGLESLAFVNAEEVKTSDSTQPWLFDFNEIAVALRTGLPKPTREDVE